MDINAIVQTVAKMFPNAKIPEAVQQAQQIIQGAGNDLASVQKKAHEIGLNQTFVNQMYQKYANTPIAGVVCKLLGTSPDALKDDAMNIVGGSALNVPQNTTKKSLKFPRLK